MIAVYVDDLAGRGRIIFRQDIGCGYGHRMGDFRDPASQQVLGEAARRLARELGRQAARAWWGER